MTDARSVHRGATRLMSTIMVLLGLAMLVGTVVEGGGPISLGVLLGILFIAAGAARLYLASRMGAR